MRDTYIDIAKGISMLMIVRIHTEGAYEMHIPYPVIAVPFFFFVSGFFDKGERPWGTWLKKNAYSLLVPAVIWSLITWGVVASLSVMKSGNLNEISFPVIGGGVTWFLVALFVAKILVGIIERIVPVGLKYRQWLMYGCVFAICWTLAGINLPLMIDEGLTALPFYLLGKVLYPRIKQLCGFTWLVIAGFIIAFMMLWPPFPAAVISFNSFSDDIRLYPLFCFVIICAFIPLLRLCMLIKSNWLSDFGQNTLGVLVLHPLILHVSAVVLNRAFVKGSVVWMICFSIAYVVAVVLSYYATKLIVKKCPVLLGR